LPPFLLKVFCSKNFPMKQGPHVDTLAQPSPRLPYWGDLHIAYITNELGLLSTPGRVFSFANWGDLLRTFFTTGAIERKQFLTINSFAWSLGIISTVVK
jgi:hypothetical protein